MARLDPGERRADADMGAATEGDMGGAFLGDIELLRGLEDLGVAVARSERHEHRLAFLHRAAGDGAVLLHDAGGNLHRRLVAQHFLHRLRGKAWIGNQQLPDKPTLTAPATDDPHPLVDHHEPNHADCGCCS